jgi:hypothetical protein
MHSDDLSEFHVDLEGRNLARRAMDARATQLGRLCSSCHCAAQGSCAVRTDRTVFAGRFGDGAAVVALSSVEKWGWLRAISAEIIVNDPIH